MTWSIALVILTDVFMAVGFSVPFWVSFDQRDVPDTTGQYSVYCGVWYVLVCEAFGTESCTSQAIKTTFRNYTDITFSLSAEDMDNASNQGAILLGNKSFDLVFKVVQCDTDFIQDIDKMTSHRLPSVFVLFLQHNGLDLPFPRPIIPCQALNIRIPVCFSAYLNRSKADC